MNDRKLKSSEIVDDIEQTLVPPELMVNLGTLRLDVGKPKEAYDAFQLAITNCNLLINSGRFEGEELTKFVAIRITA